MSEPSTNIASDFRPDIRLDVLLEQGFQQEESLVCSGQPLYVYRGVSLPGRSDTKTGFCVPCSLLLHGAMSIETHVTPMAVAI